MGWEEWGWAGDGIRAALTAATVTQGAPGPPGSPRVLSLPGLSELQLKVKEIEP